MKRTNKMIAGVLLAAFALCGCDLNYFPSDELNSDVLLQDPAGAEYIMDGCYALLKDEVEYLGYASGNSYVRHYMQMAEYPADNCCLAGKTTDPLYEALAYMMTDNLKNVGTLWMLAYKVIYMCNTVIGSTTEGESAATDQLIGEAYFMRGLMHLHMVTLYAKPYSQGRDNLGVPLQLTAGNSNITRESVGKVYDQIVKDMQKAASLMGAPRGNKGYPSHDAALGVLSRVYLYMGMYNECITTVNEMLGNADPATKLEPDFANYFVNAKTSQETLFCIAHEVTDDKGQSSIGSMYNADGGWGEIYPSDPLLYLYERYPGDIRYTAFIKPQIPDPEATTYNVYFPDPETPEDASGRQNLIFKVTPAGDNYTFTDGGQTYTVEKRTVQGEYSEYHVVYKGQDCLARVSKPMGVRYNYPQYYVTKFGYQDGVSTLSSPVFCRWGEVILNRAEAYAHLNQTDNALKDVNTIRTRAGIPAEGLFADGNMHGYTDVLSVVLDERRLELAFEGHRMFDVYRNGLKMDRRFPGAQPWAVVEPTYPKIQYPIPNSEWTVSGIQQNPTY